MSTPSAAVDDGALLARPMTVISRPSRVLPEIEVPAPPGFFGSVAATLPVSAMLPVEVSMIELSMTMPNPATRVPLLPPMPVAFRPPPPVRIVDDCT